MTTANTDSEPRRAAIEEAGRLIERGEFSAAIAALADNDAEGSPGEADALRGLAQFMLGDYAASGSSYAAALAAHLRRHSGGRSTLMNIAYAFCLLNWATVLGCYRFARGRQQVTWQKAQHAAPPPAQAAPSEH